MAVLVDHSAEPVVAAYVLMGDSSRVKDHDLVAQGKNLRVLVAVAHR